MTLWRKARTEAAGAWRSVRYDLRRPEPGADEPGGRPGAGPPDVTSNGLSTFGGAGVTGGLRTSYGEQLVARPRRLAAVSAFGVLAVTGAAGSYFAVVNGIGPLVDRPVGAEPYPLAVEAPRGAASELSNSGLGGGTAFPAGGRPAVAVPATAAPVPATIRVLPTTVGAAAPKRPVVPPRPPRTTAAGRPASPTAECCLAPPVPTPTAPVPTPHSPSATSAPDDSPPPRSDSPEPSESPSWDEPIGPDDAPSNGEYEEWDLHPVQD